MREPIPGPPHPERWRDDMNPDFMAGQNFAEAAPSAKNRGSTPTT